jgi:AAA+ ATPase superfamily predicted ATPase
MKFYDRENELQILEKIAAQSSETACFTVMVGRRRIGKTALLLRSAEKHKMLYLFVSRNSEAVLCSGFQQQASEALGLQIYGTINLEILEGKADTLQKHLSKYKVSLKSLSLGDM